tara:strand:+ start:154 stop:459 length:306 start_codon:yes stop_codon:yes gene_type:complete
LAKASKLGEFHTTLQLKLRAIDNLTLCCKFPFSYGRGIFSRIFNIKLIEVIDNYVIIPPELPLKEDFGFFEFPSALLTFQIVSRFTGYHPIFWLYPTSRIY